MEMNWSRWFRCESSFALILVPAQPGIYALAEETAAMVEPCSRRMLAILEIDETEELQRSLSRLFASGSRWRERLASGRCFLRYAVVHDAAERHTAAGALRKWSVVPSDTAQMFGHDSLDRRGLEAATVSERAVERLARTEEYEKVFPARV